MNRFDVIDAPLHANCYQRISDAEKENILKSIHHLCQQYDPTQENSKRGIFLVNGENGVGKTYFISNLFRDKRNNAFFTQQCHVNIVVWLNCFQWKDEHSFDCNAVDRFYTILVDLLVKITKDEQVTELAGQISLMSRQRLSPIFVFDDVFHFSLMSLIHEQLCSSVPCVAIARRSCLTTMQLSTPEVQAIVLTAQEIAPMGNADIAKMLSTTYALKDYFDEAELRDIADRCNGSPKVAAEFASNFKNGIDGLFGDLPSKVSALEYRKRAAVIESFFANKVIWETTGLQDLILIDVPQFEQYYHRSSEEDAVRKGVKAAALQPGGGIFVIAGGPGIGKSSVVSHVLRDIKNHPFFQRSCAIQIVVWLNCYQWREGFAGRNSVEEEFLMKLLHLAMHADPTLKEDAFESFDQLSQYYADRGQRVLFVLDDVFHHTILDSVRLNFESSAICCAITRDIAKLRKFNISPFSDEFQDVKNPYLVGLLSDSRVVDIFQADFKLKDRLSENQLRELARCCYGIPLLVSLVGSQFHNCKNYEKRFFEVLSVKIGKLRFQRQPATGRVVKTAAQNFEVAFSYLEGILRQKYYIFLLFDPAESVDISDLAFLWHCSSEEAWQNCIAYENLSLIRPIVEEEEISYLVGHYQGQSCKHYLIHQILHEIAAEECRKQFDLVIGSDNDLSQLRVKIILALVQRHLNTSSDHVKLVKFLTESVASDRRYLLELILQHIKPANSFTFSEDLLTSLEHFDETLQLRKEAAVQDCDGFNALMIVAKNGHLSLTQLIYSEKATTEQNVFGKTALMYAVENGKLEVARFLAAKTPHVLTLQDLDGKTTLMFAADSKIDIAFLKFLAETNSLAIEIQDKNGRTALMYAVLSRNVDGAKILAAKCPSAVKMQDVDGMTALFFAIDGGFLDLARVLVEKWPPVVALQNKNSRSALIDATLAGYWDLAKFMADKCPGAIGLQDSQGQTAMMIAADERNYGFAKFLAARNPTSIMRQNRNGKTALMFAASYGNLDLVKFLVEKCPEAVRLQDSSSQTVMVLAAARLYFEIVRYLGEKVPDCIAIQDKNGRSAVSFAAQHGDFETVKVLVTKNAGSVKLLDIDKKPVLRYAISGGDFNLFEVVLNAWPSAASLKDSDNITPLMHAARDGRLDMVKLLIKAAPEAVKLQDSEGRTALLHAAAMGHHEVVKLLQ